MSTAAARGDLAESLVPVAAELAFLVRDEGREAIGEWMDARRVAVADPQARALLIVLAAMVPADVTAEDALAWVTWDHDGRPLDQTIPLLPVLPVPSAPMAKAAPKTRVTPTPERQLGKYAKLRSAGLSVGEAAEMMGVVKRTAERYEAKLRVRRERQRQGEAA